jgi:hypothetical protein
VVDEAPVSFDNPSTPSRLCWCVVELDDQRALRTAQGLKSRLSDHGDDSEIIIVTSWPSQRRLLTSEFATVGTSAAGPFAALSVAVSIGADRQASAVIAVAGDLVVDLDLERLERLAGTIGHDLATPMQSDFADGDSYFDAARQLRPQRSALRQVMMIGCQSPLPIEPRLVGPGGWQAVVTAVVRRGGVVRMDLGLRSFDVAPRDPLFQAHRWDQHLRNDIVAADPQPVALELDIDQRVRTTTELEMASPWWFFESMVVINLARQVTRRADTQARAEVQGFGDRLAWFPAIEVPGRTSEAICLSHRVVIEDAARRGVEHVLIFEDDVVFTADAQQRLRVALSELGESWQIGYLGGIFELGDAPPGTTTEPLSPLLEINFPLYTAHAYVVHRRGFDTLLAGLPTTLDESAQLVAEYSHIDNWYAHLLSSGQLRGWLMTPAVAAQADQLSRHRFELTTAEQSRYLG